MTSDDILRRGRIGRWRVVRLIGEGGFSWVFEVEDEKSGKRLALKMLQPKAGAGEEYRRFWKEARILAAQNDPHLVTIVMLERDEELGVDYYVMELLTGRDLAKLLKAEGEQPTKRVIAIFLGALQGLARLHAARPPVIHRDIKPANIQITDDGRAKVLDLSIAGTQRGGGDETFAATDDTYTTTALFKGTPKYASPEQLQVLDLDTSTDVFSMGLCLFEALEGRHPYTDQPDLPTLTYQSVLSFYVRLEGGRKQISLEFRRSPKLLQSVVRKALSLRPADRYCNAGEMHRALAQAAEGQDAAPTPRTSDTQMRPRPGRRPQAAGPRQRWVPLAAAAAVLVLGVGAGTWWWVSQGGEGTEPVEVTKKIAPKVVEKALPSGPTPEQAALREDATRVLVEVERLLGEASVEADHAARVIGRKQEGDRLWAQERFQDAQDAYEEVISFGKQVIAGAGGTILAREKQPAEQAQERARQESAELNAATEWSAAEDLLKQAQRAESESRTTDAARQYAGAREAYEVARTMAMKTLEAAQKAEKAARTARARLPGRGDCRALGEPKARSTCEAGAHSLTEGSDALAAKNALSASDSFQLAKEQFEKSRKLIPATPPIVASTPPTLPPRTELGRSGRIEAPTHEAPVTEARREPATAPDATADVKATLKEYADAISNCDIETLRSIYPGAVPLLQRYMRECSLAATVTPVGAPKFLNGGRAKQQISQSIHTVTKEGKRIVLAEGPFEANLSQRGDGWYIDSIRGN